MKLKHIALLMIAVFLPELVNAKDSKIFDNFDIMPVVLNSENSESSTLGLQYNIDGKLLDIKFEGEEGDEINPDAVIGGADISFSTKGLIVENYKNNPKDFLESRISANYFRSSSFSMKAGTFVEMESDQRFDNKQLVYGFTATSAQIDTFADNDILALHINIGQVDPSEDNAREAVLGSNLDTYTRIDLEFLYIYNIGTDYLDTFEVNYRYFKEFDAESSIKQANLDEFKLVTFRLGFKNNLFIAYSAGELPFNEKDDQIYEIGFNYKFQ